jgi:DNA-binding NarL/FixJ family response regulator
MGDPEAPQIRVLVADEHGRVRWALRMALQEEAGLEVVGEVSEAPGLLAEAQALRPDLILLEWELSGESASHLLGALRALQLPCQIIVLSRDPDSKAAALTAGADAFVSKSDPPDELLQVLRGLARA